MYTQKRWFNALIKKLLGVVSPHYPLNGFKYEYDYMKRRLKHEN